MVTPYRPDGWEGDVPLEISPLGTRELHKIDRFSYEAGADAMLEGLRASKEPSCEVYIASVNMLNGKVAHPKAYGQSFPGKMVFIPEEVTT